MISIIDDDLLVRESTADLISSLGHEALIFGFGEQFLASGCLKRGGGGFFEQTV